MKSVSILLFNCLVSISIDSNRNSQYLYTLQFNLSSVQKCHRFWHLILLLRSKLCWMSTLFLFYVPKWTILFSVIFLFLTSDRPGSQQKSHGLYTPELQICSIQTVNDLHYKLHSYNALGIFNKLNFNPGRSQSQSKSHPGRSRSKLFLSRPGPGPG